jgi:hypothetical protein
MSSGRVSPPLPSRSSSGRWPPRPWPRPAPARSSTGNLADSRFTLTFHGDDGILGDAGGDRAHIFGNLPGVSSYGVLPNLQFNSTGGLNTVSRSAPGV